MSRTARKVSVGLVALLCANVAAGAEFRTADALKAFVYGEYPPGDDYFIQGNADTYLFRCVLTKATAGFDGVALSEISIWGNRTGPWEVFRQADDGAFVYVETRHLADTSCLETCRSREYLVPGRCRWERGWPRR